MLIVFILLPLLVAIGCFVGLPARRMTQTCSLILLALALSAFTSLKDAPWWTFSYQMLEQPRIVFHLALTPPSLAMLLLACLVFVAASFVKPQKNASAKLWFGSILLIVTGALGAFLSADVFFFYAFHELALIPTFLMIGILGKDERRAIAWKATLYLAFGSIILLAGLLLGLQGQSSWNIWELQQAPIADQNTIALLLLIGFGTLVSLFPFHSWAAPAYASAPTPVAMLHAGVLKKFGLYGLLFIGMRIAPSGFLHWMPWLCVCLLGNILWVGLVTLNQKSLDKILGHSSVMHMGYLFLALAALSWQPENPLAPRAMILLMVAHGISIALLFYLCGLIKEKTGTLYICDLGGLAKPLPRLGFLFGLAAMASIGLPGLANFPGELLTFFAGFWHWTPSEGFTWPVLTTMIALWGVVLSAIYMLRAYASVFQGGPSSLTEGLTPLTLVEKAPAWLLAASLILFGIFPHIL